MERIKLSGENAHNAKLKASEVLKIRQLYKNGVKVVDICKIYINISKSNIKNIIANYGMT